MAIQSRRGPAAKFDPAKLLPGEWAVELDAKRVHMCFAAGDTRRMATYEEMKENIKDATEEIREQLIADVEEAGASAAAEVLDTKQDSYSCTIDLSASTYNQNTWYPITGTIIPKGGLHKIHVYSHFDMGSHPSWATNSAGYTCNMEIYDKAQTWGQADGAAICLDYSWKHTNQRPCGYVQMTHSSTPVLILRGGGIYKVITDYESEWKVRTEAYTLSGDTVRPAAQSRFDFNRATVFADIDGDVTGNVTGTLNGFTLEKSVPADAVFTDTVYTHPTGAGNKHIPSGGSSGQILRWNGDGAAVWGDDQHYTNAEIDAKVSDLKAQIAELQEVVNGSSGTQILEAITPEIGNDGYLWILELEDTLVYTQQDTVDRQCIAFQVSAGEKYKIETFCLSDMSHPVYLGAMGENPQVLYDCKEMAVPVMAGMHSYFVTIPDNASHHWHLAVNSEEGGSLKVYKCISQ